MYLFPTKDEIDALWREISPKARCLRAMRQAVDYACTPGCSSMAAFFLESDDICLREEDSAMSYHIDPPRFMEYSRGTDTVNFTGWDIIIPDPYEYENVDLGQKVSWDEI
jgi:hypothetical protein